jgi:hypothetical protein
MALASQDPKRVIASPTKEFFIYMLTKDIELSRAILDLVDNCIDGARRTRPNGKYSGLTIRIEVNKSKFRIADNCGGIDIHLAREYAFRFGRPSQTPKLRHSVGQFGVGMKRALFKIGRHFTVTSASATSRFELSQSVEEWKEDVDNWDFKLASLEEDISVPINQRGTTIEVTNLHVSVRADFDLDNFRHRLTREIQEAHQEAIHNGIAITLNKIPLEEQPITLLTSEKIYPAFRSLKFQLNGGSPVRCRLYTGVAKSAPAEAGWYVYCNGRLVLARDRSDVTGWGEGRGRVIPHYHNQFARFRGYSFFDCDDAALLPWNTTKTGVDTDAKVYRGVRAHMLKLMRPVIDFLNALDAEHDREDDRQPLGGTIDSAKETPLAKIKRTKAFVAPKAKPAPTGPPVGRIVYTKPLDQIEAARRELKATSLKEVGEKTFEYYFDNECD